MIVGRRLLAALLTLLALGACTSGHRDEDASNTGTSRRNTSTIPSAEAFKHDIKRLNGDPDQLLNIAQTLCADLTQAPIDMAEDHAANDNAQTDASIAAFTQQTFIKVATVNMTPEAAHIFIDVTQGDLCPENSTAFLEWRQANP